VLTSFGQSNSPLVSFTVQFYETSVFVKWTIKAGFSCTDVSVEHSADSINFNSVYTYPGICGASQTDKSYLFTHENAFIDKANYYRLNLGNYGFSEVLKIENTDYVEGVVIAPNPITTSGKIKFSNPDKELFRLRVFDMRGILVYSSQTESNEFEILRTNFSGGVYLYSLSGRTKNYKGKFVIQ
jgi:hypothetical protein